jgi:hypothetical protein
MRYRIGWDRVRRLTRVGRGGDVAHNGTSPHGGARRSGWACETWGRAGDHLRDRERQRKTSNQTP